MQASSEIQGPLCDVADELLLKRFTAFGRLSREAARRALALLPEIVRRGLYRKAGFRSPVEFAQKKVGVSQDVVEKVLRLHDRIGSMPALWGLLVTGSEGWTKLEIIAPIATPDTAAWWAERIPRCTRAELAEHVRRLRSQHPSRCSVEGSALDRTEPLVIPPAIPLAIPPAIPQAIETDGGSPAIEAAGLLSTPAGDYLALDAGDSRTASDDSTTESRFEPQEGELPNPLPALPKLRSVTLYLEPDDDDLLRALQQQIEHQRGQAISLGEVVSLLLNQAARLAEADSLRPGVASTDPGGEGIDAGAEPSAAPELRSDGANAADKGDHDDQDVTAAVAKVLHRSVEVVVRIADLGAAWAARFKGILPIGIARAFRPENEVVLLGDLYSTAVLAAGRCRGQAVPVAVRKFVALRAQLRCETPGCIRPISEIHHLKPRSQDGDHHPDNCRALCGLHHDSAHAEIFVDGQPGKVVDPGDWAPRRPADHAFQQARARAVDPAGPKHPPVGTKHPQADTKRSPEGTGYLRSGSLV